jgi:ligand-binding SRPBCC domain-containing protein
MDSFSVTPEPVLMPLFNTNSLLNCSATSLRNFLGRPANLPDISDPDIELEIVQAPAVIEVGEKIIFRVTAMGLRQRMTHEYLTASEFEILESLIEGPLPLWRHRQHLEALSDNQCRLTDEVEFQPPGGLLRFVLTEQRIRESLEAGMTFRYQALAERISSGALL